MNIVWRRIPFFLSLLALAAVLAQRLADYAGLVYTTALPISLFVVVQLNNRLLS